MGKTTHWQRSTPGDRAADRLSHFKTNKREKKNDQENIEKYQQSAFLVGEFCQVKRHRQSLAKAELENTVEGTRLRYSTILLIVNDEYKNIYNISSCNRLICTNIYPPPSVTYSLGRGLHCATERGNTMTAPPPLRVTDASLVMSSAHVGGQLIHLSAAVRRGGSVFWGGALGGGGVEGGRKGCRGSLRGV